MTSLDNTTTHRRTVESHDIIVSNGVRSSAVTSITIETFCDDNTNYSFRTEISYFAGRLNAIRDRYEVFDEEDAALYARVLQAHTAEVARIIRAHAGKVVEAYSGDMTGAR